MKFPKLSELNLENKRVFLRADLNVPIKERSITNDKRLQAIIPTLEYLLSHNASIVLGTHLGRPPAHNRTNYYDPNLSTKILLPWFHEKGYSVVHEQDIARAQNHSIHHGTQIILLENLRFFNGERETNDAFANKLARTADVYINDAFGMLHRHDTSVTLLAKQFDKKHRAFGLLIEKEFASLSTLTTNPQQPFVIVMGGNKPVEKLSLLIDIMSKPQSARPESILLGGLSGAALSAIKGIDTGANKFDEQTEKRAELALQKAEENSITLCTPTDFVFNKQNEIVDIGPETIKQFLSILDQAHTVFANGTMGIYEKGFEKGTRDIFESLSASKAHVTIGGGNAIAAVDSFGLTDKMDFISTGGGATLAFLAAKKYTDLPAIAAMMSTEK